MAALTDLQQLNGTSKTGEEDKKVSPFISGGNFFNHLWGDKAFSKERNNPLVAPYYSRQGDKDLRALSVRNDLWSIGISNFWNKVMSNLPILTPNNSLFIGQTIPDNVKQNISLISLIIERCWYESIGGLIYDYITQNNGGFIEFIDNTSESVPATTPLQPVQINGLEIPFIKIRYLDSENMYRTGVEEFPYRFRDKVLFHRSRILALSSMPQWNRELKGVGVCAGQRFVNSISIDQSIQDYMLDQAFDGMVGGIIVAAPFETDHILDAMKLGKEKQGNQGSDRWNRYAVLTNSQNTKIFLETIDLRRLPENFEYKEHLESIINIIAAALNIAPRDLWPHTTVGATKADAEVQERAANQKAVPLLIRQIRNAFNFFFLPQYVRMNFPLLALLQQMEEDALRKQIAERHKLELENGTITRTIAVREYQDRGYYTDEEAESIIANIESTSALNQVQALGGIPGVFR